MEFGPLNNRDNPSKTPLWWPAKPDISGYFVWVKVISSNKIINLVTVEFFRSPTGIYQKELSCKTCSFNHQTYKVCLSRGISFEQIKANCSIWIIIIIDLDFFQKKAMILSIISSEYLFRTSSHGNLSLKLWKFWRSYVILIVSHFFMMNKW